MKVGCISLFLSLVSASPTSAPTSSPPPPSLFTFRNLTATDLTAVTNTVVSAFDPGPLWSYLYQFRDRFPEYHIRCLQEETKHAIKAADRESEFGHVIVPRASGGDVGGKGMDSGVRSFGWWKVLRKAEGDAVGSGKGRQKNLMPMGLWGLEEFVEGSFPDVEELVTLNDAVSRRYVAQQEPEQRGDDLSHQAPLAKAPQPQSRSAINDQHHQPQSMLPPLLPLPCRLHLDMNFVRALHLSPQLNAIDTKYIEDAPYETQMYLSLLATHPDWDGHGFGAAQVEWGMQWAREEELRLSELSGSDVEVPVTLLATPAGYPLYDSLGFESVANETVKFLDGFDGGETWFMYMRWFPSR